MRDKHKWDKHSIKAEICRRIGTLGALEVQYGLKVNDVRVALSRPYPKGEKAIADFLGKSLFELWPDRYTKHNTRILASRRKRQAQAMKDYAEAAV